MVGFSAGAFDVERAIGPEFDPEVVVQLDGDAVQDFSNQILGAARRACARDDPGVDDVEQRGDASSVTADSLFAITRRQMVGFIFWPCLRDSDRA